MELGEENSRLSKELAELKIKMEQENNTGDDLATALEVADGVIKELKQKEIAERVKREEEEVRFDEERSNELIMFSLGTKITRARQFVHDAPPTQPQQ